MEGRNSFKNLVFEGGGVKGIAYLGMLEVLADRGILSQIERVAGASAGAITAAVVSFGLPFEELKKIADTLDYSKVPDKGKMEEVERLSDGAHAELEGILDDIVCVYRLIKKYGWYTSDYIYNWLKTVIAKQFNDKKQAPYTFADFQNAALHKSGKPFCNLYVIGTDIYTTTAPGFFPPKILLISKLPPQ